MIWHRCAQPCTLPPGLSSLSLSQLGFDSFCTLARQLPRRDGSRGDPHTQLTFQLPCVFISLLLLSLEASSLLDNYPDQMSLGNGKTLNRELVDMSQYGFQGLPCSSSATQESEKVNVYAQPGRLPAFLLAMPGLFKILSGGCSPALNGRSCSQGIGSTSC